MSLRAALFSLLPLVLACKDAFATKKDCEKMIDHYLDLSILADPQLARLPKEEASAVREVKRALKRGEKSYKKVEARCEKAVTTSERDCAMEARTPASWEACIK